MMFPPRYFNVFALVNAVTFSSRNLACQRVTMHKHMFLTYVLNSISVIVYLTLVVPKIDYVNSDPVSTALFVFNSIFKDVTICK